MNNLAITKTLTGSVDDICNRVTEAIKPAGFGVLTRIDFDQKIMEKLNQKIAKTVILGACHPGLAYEAFKQSTDVALLVPCNIVIRETEDKKVVVEALRPTTMLKLISAGQGNSLAEKVENDLKNAILNL